MDANLAHLVLLASGHLDPRVVALRELREIPMSTSTAIATVRLVKRLPSGGDMLTILDEVDVEIRQGESVAIVGPSGSGKSTLLGLMAGLDRPTSGEVWLAGRRIDRMSEDELSLVRREHVGFVFQSFQLLGNLTALENVLVPLELAGHGGARDRARSLLSEVGLAERTHHYPSQLSGGEQQRVALARANSASRWRVRSRRNRRSSSRTNRRAISTERPVRRSWL